MSKELFDAVVGTPPPSTVDVPGIIRRRRRVIMARRLGTGVASVVAVLALGMIVSAISAQLGRDAAPGTTGTVSIDVNAERVREALRQAVATRVPDARWLPDGQPPAIAPPADPPSVSCADPHYCDPGGVVIQPLGEEAMLLVGTKDLARPGITGQVTLAINADESGLTCGEGTTDTCSTSIMQTGARMAIWSAARTVGGPVSLRTVVLELPGGRTLSLTAHAPLTAPTSGDAGSGTVLTEPELIDIATSIADRLAG